MINVITRHKEPCKLEGPIERYYRKPPMSQTENGLYLLHNGGELHRSVLIEAEPTPKIIENNLRNFYIVVLMDHINRFLWPRKAVFSYKGSCIAIDDFECGESEIEMASVFAAAYSIVNHDEHFKTLHNVFVLFNSEKRQKQLVFDLSPAMCRFYIDFAGAGVEEIASLASFLTVWDSTSDALSLTIAEKKRRLRRKLLKKAWSKLLFSAYWNLKFNNCYGIWD